MDIKKELDYFHSLTLLELQDLKDEILKKDNNSIDNLIVSCNYNYIVDRYEAIQEEKKTNRCIKR